MDPLVCPKCNGEMKIIAPVEDYKVVKKILDYLKIYEIKRERPPPGKYDHCDGFDDYGHDDYIDCEYMDF